jgi:hypothetical protein
MPKRIKEPKRVLDQGLPLTVFESEGDWSSSSDAETLLRQIERETTAELSVIGESYEGRDIFSLSVGEGDKVIIVTGGVHRSEPASREAVLIKARDVAYDVDSVYSEYLKEHKVTFVPTVQPDRESTRANAQGLNINRDAYDLETPEMQAIMKLLADVMPDIYIDFHERAGELDRIEFINTNTFDPNTVVRNESETFVSDIMSSLEENGHETTYYPSGAIGPGKTVAASAFIGSLSFTPETHLSARSEEFRVEAQKETFDLILGWHAENEGLIQEVKTNFQSSILEPGGDFVLLNGDNEYYANATEVPMTLPEGYMLESVDAFDKWKDVYNIQVDADGFVPINQIMGRFIPHLLDPQSDMQVVKAERVE